MKQMMTQAKKIPDSLWSGGVLQHAAVQPLFNHEPPLSTYSSTLPQLQAKLKIGEPNDQYEQEADRIANQVMRMPEQENPLLLQCHSKTHFIQKQDDNTVNQNKEQQYHSKLSLQPPQPDILSLKKPFFERQVYSLWNVEDAIEVWEYSFDFLKRLGLNDILAGKASNLLAPFAIDAQLKINNPTWWEITDQELQTTSLLLPIPLFDFYPYFNNWRLLPALQDEPQVQRKACPRPKNDAKIGQSRTETHTENAQKVAPNIIQDVLSSPGQPLDEATRSFMEPRLGHDFSQVRVHTDSKAAKSAQALNAKAYTVGQNVIFGEGQYVPDSEEGRRLVAHELVHVGQQCFKNNTSSVVTEKLQRRKDDKKTPRMNIGPFYLNSYSKEVSKENVAAIVNAHLIDYREQVKSGVRGWSAPKEKQSDVWFCIALAGNLVWAATSFVNPMASGAIKAMSMIGAAIGSGTLEKAMKGEAKVAAIKPKLIKQVSTYVDNLKRDITSIVNKIYAYYENRDLESSNAGWMDANQKTQERREAAWKIIFDNQVAPWGSSTAIITNTTNDITIIWSHFERLYKLTILSIYGYPRYSGRELMREIDKIFYISIVQSGVADRSIAVKKSTAIKNDWEYKVYEFPPPQKDMDGAKVNIPTGRRIIPIELK
nr:DUF4157 domain-containing protein [uncultured Desulfobacter sp.]